MGAKNNTAFAARTDFGSPCMTHRSLISSTPASHFLHASSPSSSSPTRLPSSCAAAAAASSSAMSSFAQHHGSLVEREGRMSALRSSLLPYEADEEMADAAAAWGAAERGAGALGDGFLVEDLLDLDDLCEVDEVETYGGEQGEAAAAPPAEEEKLNDSNGWAVVCYEPMPLPEAAIDLPAHDAEELEWVSRVMDDTLVELPAAPVAAAWKPQQQQRRTQESAVSSAAAADTVRSPTICALSTEALVPWRAKRSKRSRSSVWSLSGASLSDSTSSSSTVTTTTSSCSSSGSFLPFLLMDSSPAFVAASDVVRKPKNSKHKHKPKKRGRKPKNHHLFAAAASPPAPGDRRCSHCGVQKTPQWRAGPEGAKTLCNACGVRYKSGRLLPEYRPACSPTFISTVHSSSHRKVLEMRRKKEGVDVMAAAAPAVASF